MDSTFIPSPRKAQTLEFFFIGSEVLQFYDNSVLIYRHVTKIFGQELKDLPDLKNVVSGKVEMFGQAFTVDFLTMKVFGRLLIGGVV